MFPFWFGLCPHSRFFRLVPAELLLCCLVPATPNTLLCPFATNVEGLFCLFVLLLLQH